MKETKLWL